MSLKAHMICHTHWDREWYLTREEFRTKLVRLVDGLLDIIDTVPEYVSFMLDGQTIAIEDYLEIKPYNRERLFTALKSGKIICGPWYILPDELLVSGESHIRNYMKGTEVLGENGKKMKAAYLPDSFGHPEQMPQIVKGLGMDTMVFWRGVPNKVKQTEFYWEAPYPDAKILCIHMPHGYGNCGNLSADMTETVPRVQNLVDSLGAKSSTDIILLMNGSDHIIAQKDICDIVKNLNEKLVGCQIELSTMERYLKEVKEKLGELPVYKGEFRSGERSMLLGGTLSSRMILKQKNDIVQSKIERYLEPVLALERLCGDKTDSRGYRDYLWKKILENQPHDSICGCSIDEVHSEMMTRYACIEQTEDTLMSDAVVRSSRKKMEDPGRRAELFLFEPAVRGGTSYVETDICLDETLVQEVNFTTSVIADYERKIRHPDIPTEIRITDEKGRKIPHVILGAEKDYIKLYQDHTSPEVYKVNKLRVGMLLPEFSYGCHQLSAEPVDSADGEAGQYGNGILAEKNRESQTDIYVEKERPLQIENEFYILKAGQDGISVEDKRNGSVHTGFAKLIDKGDAGDEYTYSWPETDREYGVSWVDVHVIKEKKGNLAEHLTVAGILELPESLTDDRRERSRKLVECPFSMKFTLVRGVKRIDCHMEMENHAADHRLQIQFPAGVKADFSESYDIFNITQHEVDVTVPDEWMEYPQSAHPTHGYIGIHNDREGMSIGVKGLTEYEAVRLKDGGTENGEDQTAVNITLLRCVGWLSRTDLLTRHGNGGWTIATPEAQCLGKQTFDFCIIYHGNETKKSFDQTERFRYPVYLKNMRPGSAGRWISEEVGKTAGSLPEGVELSALKPSESGDGIVMRIYSISKKTEQISLEIPEPVKCLWITDMTEDPQTELDIQRGQASVTISPGQIITLLMELKEMGERNEI